MTTDQQPKSRRFKWFTIFRYFGIALFLVVLARTDLRELWHWLKNVDGWMISLAILFQFVLLFIKCWRWFLLNENQISLRAVYQRFGEFMEAYALGVVTPGRMGEVLKAGHARGRAGVVSAGLLVIAERGLDLSLFFLMAGAALAFGYLAVLDPIVGYVLILIAIAGIVIAFSILLFPVVVRWVERIMKRLRILAQDQSMIFIRRKNSTLAWFTILSILSNLSAFLSFYFIALAVMINLTFMVISGGVAIAGVINTIPVTIMGIGTRDVALLYVLTEVPKAQVIAFSGLILLVFQVFGGLLALGGGELFLWLAKKMKWRAQNPEMPG